MDFSTPLINLRPEGVYSLVVNGVLMFGDLEVGAPESAMIAYHSLRSWVRLTGESRLHRGKNRVFLFSLVFGHCQEWKL